MVASATAEIQVRLGFAIPREDLPEVRTWDLSYLFGVILFHSISSKGSTNVLAVRGKSKLNSPSSVEFQNVKTEEYAARLNRNSVPKTCTKTV